MLEETIVNCVLTTNQTYVSNLKKDNMFDAEAQKNAFKMTYDFCCKACLAQML